jgi:1-acyl-sn-glycerol-3-phosphate acyltransferase
MRQFFIRYIPKILQSCAWLPTRLVLNFFIHFNVVGLEHLKGIEAPVIFASNHVSELDPILVRAALPCFSRFGPLFYVSRKNYLASIKGMRKYFYGGFFFKAWGAYPAQSGLKSYAESLFNHIKLLKGENSVCIFPEGRITKTGVLGEVHGGVVYLAEATHTPVVHVTITGPYKITLRDFFTRKRHVAVVFNAPLYNIHSESDDAESYREKARIIMEGTSLHTFHHV